MIRKEKERRKEKEIMKEIMKIQNVGEDEMRIKGKNHSVINHRAKIYKGLDKHKCGPCLCILYHSFQPCFGK